MQFSTMQAQENEGGGAPAPGATMVPTSMLLIDQHLQVHESLLEADYSVNDVSEDEFVVPCVH